MSVFRSCQFYSEKLELPLGSYLRTPMVKNFECDQSLKHKTKLIFRLEVVINLNIVIISVNAML